MGIIVDFPMSRRMAQAERSRDMNEPAQVVILPVVRIERMADQPASGIASRVTVRKRRRRAQRS